MKKKINTQFYKIAQNMIEAAKMEADGDKKFEALIREVEKKYGKPKDVNPSKKTIDATTLAIEYPTKYKDEMEKQRNTVYRNLVQQNEAMSKIFYHVDVLISLMDKCIEQDWFKQEIKAKGNTFLKALESYNSKMYSGSEKMTNQVQEIIAEQEEIWATVNNIHSIYYTEFLSILKKYEEGHSIEEINKSILDSQFAMFKDFHIEAIVRQQVKRIEPNADHFNILHLSEVVTREKLSKLSKLNPLTMEVMDKIMRNAQISW